MTPPFKVGDVWPGDGSPEAGGVWEQVPGVGYVLREAPTNETAPESAP